MPLPVIADTIRASVQGVMPNGHPWANVMHFRKTGALSYPAAIALLDPLLDALFTTNLGAGTKLVNFGTAIWATQKYAYTPLDGTSATTQVAHLHAGLSVSDALPPNVALVVTWYTALRGRAHRGRSYLSGFAEDANSSSGFVTAAYVTQLNSQFANWLTSFAATGVTPVVASYKNSTAQDVTSFVVNNVFDSQRRRSRP